MLYYQTVLPKNQISILAGASGSGKTTLVLQSLLAWQKGEPFPLQFTATKAAYLVSDRTKEEVESRRDTLGVDVEVYGVVDDTSFDLRWLEDPYNAFTKAVQRFKSDYDLLIIDPLMLFLEGSGLDYRQTARSLINFNRFAKQRDLTLLACHHASKTRSDFHFLRPQDRILGSAAFQGYSGTQMVLIEGRERGAEYDTFVTVPHMSPATEHNLKRGEGGWFEVYEADLPPLIQALKAGEWTTEKIMALAEELGLKRSAAFHEIKEGLKLGKLVKFEHGKYRRVA